MVVSFSKHAQPFIGSMFYRNVSEYDVKKSIDKVQKFPKEKFYLRDNELKLIIIGQVVKGKVKIITVITNLQRPVCVSKGAKILEVS